MAHKHLAIYLNDHLAGSVTVLELLAHLASAYSASHVGQFAAQLRAEILEDRHELESLMARLKIAQSPPRKTSAWLAEKLAELKLRLDDPAAGAFRLFEATEAISLGIEGKRLLWQALAARATDPPELRGGDFDRLIRRAEDQRRRVEAVRIDAARTALAVAQ
jgi:hypothetical protein